MTDEAEWEELWREEVGKPASYDKEQFEVRLREFYGDFSIEAYLQLRSDFPGVHIPIQRLGGLDAISPMEKRLEAFGIDGQTLAQVMDANPAAIETVCVVLLEQLARERLLQSEGKTQLQSRGLTPTTSVCFSFVCICFEAMEWNDDPQNISALHFLQQQLLLPGKPEIKAEMERSNFKFRVEYMAAELLAANGAVPSFRMLARMFRVAPTSISRLFPDHLAFSRKVEAWAKWIEEEEPKLLSQLASKSK